MGRSAVAAEDANFCHHWGFDMAAIRAGDRGGQQPRRHRRISQQVVKNVFLWHGRSWLRKAMEAVLTPAVELVWSKQRILEVYLNVAEFDEGVFGVQAAAQHYFGVDAHGPDAPCRRRGWRRCCPTRRGAMRVEAVAASSATATRSIISGAETIAADGVRLFRAV